MFVRLTAGLHALSTHVSPTDGHRCQAPSGALVVGPLKDGTSGDMHAVGSQNSSKHDFQLRVYLAGVLGSFHLNEASSHLS